MQNVSVEIPTTTFAALGESPDRFVSEMRIAVAVKWDELGRLSQGKAAEVSGLTRSAFIDALSRFKVSPMQCSERELINELRRVIHAHPTVSEAVMEAAEGVHDLTIHM